MRGQNEGGVQVLMGGDSGGGSQGATWSIGGREWSPRQVICTKVWQDRISRSPKPSR